MSCQKNQLEDTDNMLLRPAVLHHKEKQGVYMLQDAAKYLQHLQIYYKLYDIVSQNFACKYKQKSPISKISTTQPSF